MQKNTLKKLKHGEIVKPAFKYIIDLTEESFKKTRRQVDIQNQINFKKQLYRQTDLIWPRNKLLKN